MISADLRAAVVSVVRVVLGMEITHKPRSRLRSVAAQFLLGVAGLALITFVCFRLDLGVARTGFAYVILVALVSLMGSFSASVVLSIVAAACLDYFFAPPLFELRVDALADIERIAAFLTTSLLVTVLITKRKRAEEELVESRARFEEAQRLAHVGWWERDLITGHVTVSDEVCRILGVRPVAQWLNLIHPEDRPRAAEAAAAALLPGGPRYDVEYRVVRPDGAIRMVHSQGDVTRDESGRPLRQFGVLQDITELRQAEKELRASEQALRRSEAYLAEAQRLSHTGTLAFNATAPVYWSEESYRIWGLDPLEGLPNRETVLQRIHPDDRERVNVETEQALHEKRSFTLEFRIVLPDGTVKHIESTGRPLFSADGELVEMVATHVDVTERKRAQEEHEKLRQLESDLAHMNRLSIMGELTASLAHEILHPNASARNNARAAMRFLDMRPPNMAEVREALACIVRDADRGKDIVDRIRAHIKKAPPRHDRFDINEAIGEVIEMARAPIEKNRVSVHTHLAAGLISVWGDHVQLQQVVLNLILNAIEAMGSVGERARFLSIRTEQRGTAEILVAIHDSGPGIYPEHLQRAFEPFYTTKTSGLGMGLSICRSIIDAHGGRLWADANEPRGAVFQFTLPGAERELSNRVQPVQET